MVTEPCKDVREMAKPQKKAPPIKPIRGRYVSDDDLKVELGLPDDATPLEFLTAVYQSELLPVNVRLDAAKNAAMYRHPRLIAVAAIKASDEKLYLSGGLPTLPGTTIDMPSNKVQIDGEIVKDPDK
jgi:hypothetical protein